MAIGGVDTRGLQVQDVTELLRGPQDSEVRLVLAPYCLGPYCFFFAVRTPSDDVSGTSYWIILIKTIVYHVCRQSTEARNTLSFFLTSLRTRLSRPRRALSTYRLFT